VRYARRAAGLFVALAKKLTLLLPRSPRQGVIRLNLALVAHGPPQPGVNELLTVVPS